MTRAGFTVGDIYNIDFPDDSFDVVYSFEVLEHLHEPDRALRELARVARQHVVLSVPHEPFFCLANAARGKNLDIRPRGSDPDHRNFWSRQAFGEFALRPAEAFAQFADAAFHARQRNRRATTVLTSP